MNLIQSHWQFIASLVSIVIVDLTLSGDNAVVIAAAAKSLPGRWRRRAMIAGAACAVVTLVVATFFASRLLTVQFLQIAGAAAVLWIAVGLFRPEPPLQAAATQLTGFWKAMWFIIVADVTMSTDNILAVAALAHGNWVLLVFGLGVSIPLVVFASGLLAAMMDRYPVIIYIGAALLGRVAARMMITDAYIERRFAPGAALQYSAEAAGILGVLAAGWWMKTRSRRTAGSA
jgi:YjbE family integral membrane protein